MTNVAHEPTSIEEREERIQEIDARLAELDAEHAGTVMSDAASDEWESLNAERDQHYAAVRELRVRRERLRELAGNPAATERAATDTPAFIRKRGDEIFDVARIRSDARSEDEYRDLLHENARRVIERSHFPTIRARKGARTQEDIRARVEDVLRTADDERGTLAKRILQTGSPLYDRAFGKAIKARSIAVLSPEEQRAMSLVVDADGGYAVPVQLDASVILTNEGSINPLRQISRVEQIVGKEWQGLTSEGIEVERVGEVQEADDNAPDFDQPTVRPSAVQAFVPFSMDLDQDWARLRTEITRMLADAKDREEASSFINGSGALITGPDGGHIPSGIVSTLPAGSEVPGGASFTSQDLYDLETGDNGLGPRFRARARWLANKSIYNLARQFDTQGGADLWVRLGDGLPSELIGYPAHEASEMPSTATGRYLVFGDFNEYLVVDRLGMSVELVPHVFGSARRMPTGQRGIYARWRNSTKILVPEAFRVLTDDES